MKPAARLPAGFFLAWPILGFLVGCASPHPPRAEENSSFSLSAPSLRQLQYACGDLDTRGALEELSGRPPAPGGLITPDFRADVQHNVRMVRRVHPAVALNAITLLGGYFVFFFRVEADVVSKVSVSWRDGSAECFTVTRHGRYFHPGYLPPPPDPAVRRILFYEDVRSLELGLAGREIAGQLLSRYAARSGSGSAEGGRPASLRPAAAPIPISAQAPPSCR